jgi:hypothetical protein
MSKVRRKHRRPDWMDSLVAPRLRLMAVVLNDNWGRFEAGDHQKLAWILCEAIRDGMLT